MKVEIFQNGIKTIFTPLTKVFMSKKEAGKLIQNLQEQLENGLPDEFDTGNGMRFQFVIKEES